MFFDFFHRDFTIWFGDALSGVATVTTIAISQIAGIRLLRKRLNVFEQFSIARISSNADILKSFIFIPC